MYHVYTNKMNTGFYLFFSGWDILFPGGFIFLILISKNKQLSDITKDSVCVVLKNQLNKPGLCTKRRGTKWTDGLESLTTMWNRKFRPVPVIRSKFTVHCTSIYLSTLKKTQRWEHLKVFSSDNITKNIFCNIKFCDKLLIRGSLCSKIHRNIYFADEWFFSTRGESRQLQRTWQFSPMPYVRRDWSSEWEDLSPRRNSAHIPSSIWWTFHPTKENFNITNNFSFLQIVL